MIKVGRASTHLYLPIQGHFNEPDCTIYIHVTFPLFPKYIHIICIRAFRFIVPSWRSNTLCDCKRNGCRFDYHLLEWSIYIPSLQYQNKDPHFKLYQNYYIWSLQDVDTPLPTFHRILKALRVVWRHSTPRFASTPNSNMIILNVLLCRVGIKPTTVAFTVTTHKLAPLNHNWTQRLYTYKPLFTQNNQ